MLHIGEDILDHGLGAPVRIGRLALGHILGQGQRLRRAINRSRTRENDVLAARIAHGFEQLDRAANIVVIVLDGLFDRFAHGLEAGKVNHAVDVMLGEDLAQLCLIADITLDKGDVDSRDGLDTVEDNRRCVA